MRLPMPRARTADSGRALVAAALTGSPQPSKGPAASPLADQPAPSQPPPPIRNEGAVPAVPPAPAPRRSARYGLEIQLEEVRDAVEPARLVESTVWINTAHPAYRRALASRAEGYHVALAAALALARVAVEPAEEHAFLVSFLSEWGSALTVARAGKAR